MKKAAIGKPSKLTDVVQGAILEGLRAGLPIDTAAERAGVQGSTVREWLQRGTGSHARPQAPRYAAFAEAVACAKADAEAALLAEIRDGNHATGAPDWKARAWMLERTRPERYAQTVQVRAKVDEELGAALDRLRKGLDSAAFSRVLRILADDGAGADGTGADAASDEDGGV